MAVDKLVDSTQLNADLTSVANAIRTKSGTSAQLAFPAGFVSAIEAIPTGGGSSVKYTRYTLTGDTTLKALLESINYQVQDAFALCIMIRASGTVAPSQGNYTLNNYIFYFHQNTLFHGKHLWQGGQKTPDSFQSLPATNENDTAMAIQNGILVSTASSATSCLGASGDVVTIAEMPIDIDNTIMEGGAI